MWIVLGLLVLALGGFGVGNFGGTLRTVAAVGEVEVSVDDYARALQSEQTRLSQATGQSLTLDQLRLFGIDQQVMERLLIAAALEQEAAAIGLSRGDAAVAERVRAAPAFRGVDGQFDREAYGFALRNAGLDERRFEERVRSEAAAELLQAAVAGGIAAPAGYAETVAAWLAETREMTLAEVTAATLDAGAVAPDEGEIEAFYEENASLFEVPERRRITYAWADPDTLAADIAVTDDEVRALYESRAEEFRVPRRVLAERLAFRDDAAAEAARAAIDAGERSFDDIVAERGLTLEDVDQGELAEGDVAPDVASALFALEQPGIAGPVETSLGPALYRVNAVLDARETPFERVREDLALEAAADAARRAVAAAREPIDDLLAGGATLEELGEETIMSAGTMAFDADALGGLAAYEEFRAAADTLEEGDFPTLIDLADGGLMALRLDGVDPAETPALDDVRAEVEAAWQSDSLRRRLASRAGALAERARAGETFEALGLDAQAIEGIEREGVVEGVPPRLIEAVFRADQGAVLAEEGDETRAFIVRIDAVGRPDPSDPRVAELVDAISAQAARELAADVFAAYGLAVREAAGFTVDQTAVQAVQAQLLGR